MTFESNLNYMEKLIKFEEWKQKVLIIAGISFFAVIGIASLIMLK